MGAAVRIDEIGILLDAELAQAGRCPCEAKASLSSIKSKSLIFSPSRSISLRVAGTGADAHDPRAATAARG